MSKLTFVRLLAVLLLLVAGYLWSGKLGRQVLASSIAENANADPERITLLKERIAEKKDPIELVAMGRSFLSSGGANYAIVVLEQATVLSPNYRDAWYLLGYSYAQLMTQPGSDSSDLARKAKEALEKSRLIDPNHQPTSDLLKQLNK